MQLYPGQVFDGKFEIVALIGNGGMGRIYKANQIALQRTVAIKIINTEEAGPEELERFNREALAMGQLSHSGVVSIYGHGVVNQHPYLVMEFVEGKTLSSILSDQQPLGVARTLSLMADICEAIAYTHRNGVVHRDLKPDNLMITGPPAAAESNQTDSAETKRAHDSIAKQGSSGTQSSSTSVSTTVQAVIGHKEVVKEHAKVIDLGLAKLLPRSGKRLQQLTQTGYAVGSVLYMSPEECTGRKADYRSDIYSLGIIMHECLTGRRPFESNSAENVMLAHVNIMPPLIIKSIGAEDVPGLQAILHKALAKDATHRYQQVGEMLSDIRLAQNGWGNEITEPAPEDILPTQKGHSGFSCDRRLLATVGALLIVVAITAIVSRSRLFIDRSSASNSLAMFIESDRAYDRSRQGGTPTDERPFLKILEQDSVDHELSIAQRLNALVHVSNGANYNDLHTYARQAYAVATKLGFANTDTFQVANEFALCANYTTPKISRLEALNVIETIRKMPTTCAPTYKRACDYCCAYLRFASGQFDKATAENNRLLKLALSDPSMERGAQILTLGAACLLHEGKLKECIRIAQNTLADHSPIVEVQLSLRTTLFLAHMQQNEIESAKEAIDTTLKNGYGYPAIEMLMYANEGNWAKAEQCREHLGTVAKEHPSHYFVWFFDVALNQYAAAAKANGKATLAESVAKQNERLSAQSRNLDAL